MPPVSLSSPQLAAVRNAVCSMSFHQPAGFSFPVAATRSQGRTILPAVIVQRVPLGRLIEGLAAAGILCCGRTPVAAGGRPALCSRQTAHETDYHNGYVIAPHPARRVVLNRSQNLLRRGAC